MRPDKPPVSLTRKLARELEWTMAEAIPFIPLDGYGGAPEEALRMREKLAKACKAVRAARARSRRLVPPQD